MTGLASSHLQLECFPPLPEHVARAWDAADDYLLATAEDGIPGLIINDRFGALACARPHDLWWNDSASAAVAAEYNLARNQLPPLHDRQLSTLDAVADDVRQVLLHIPKNQDQLHHWLNILARHAPDATMLLAGMARHIPVSLLKWLEANSGHYDQLPIERKARLIRIRQWQSPALKLWKGYKAENGLTLDALPGVFAREAVDIGSRVLLNKPSLPAAGRVIDLGCGNGLLALSAAKANPQLEIIATDDSQAAVLSARRNAEVNGLKVDVRHGDVLAAISEKADLILCNPPFHDGHRQLTNIAQRMFEDSQRLLNANGQLCVIANRHLPYLPILRSLFRNTRVVSSDPKFSLYLCSNA